MELFVDWLTEPNEKIVEFGIWGICNSCVGNCSDFIFGDIIISCVIVYVILTRSGQIWRERVFEKIKWLQFQKMAESNMLNNENFGLAYESKYWLWDI